MTVKLNPTAKLQATQITMVLLLLFAIPIILSLVFYYGKTELHLGTVNNGYLLSPPLQLSKLPVKLINGVPAAETPLPKKWNILYLTENTNSPHQLQVFDKINRVRLALGKDFSRVRQSYAIPFRAEEQNLDATISSHFQNTLQLAIEDAGVKKLLQQSPSTEHQQDAIFIIDPLGNIVLSYNADVKPDDMYKDLQRLLQYSSIG